MGSRKVNKITFAWIVADNLLSPVKRLEATVRMSNGNASKCMSMAWDFAALNGSREFIIRP